MSDELFEKACHNGDLDSVKKMIQENEEYKEWITDDCHPDILNWHNYGDIPDKIEIDTRKLIEIITSIKSHTFSYGDWQSELEWAERGGGSSDNVGPYIYDMEHLVDVFTKKLKESNSN